MSVGPYKNAGRCGPGGVLRRRARQRLRGGRQHRPADLDPQGGRAPRRGDDRRADLSRRTRVRAGAGTERGRPGRHARSTSAARSAAASRRSTRTPAQVLWKTYTIDEPKPRGKNKDGMQQWGPAGARHLVVADGGCQARHGLRRHRQQLRRSVAEDERRRHRARHEERHDQVGEPDDAQRQLDAGLPAREPGQPELPGEDGPRSRLLRLAEPGHGQRTRSARAAAEVGHGLRARSRQGRRDRVAVPHRPGQRPRRTVGRRG